MRRPEAHQTLSYIDGFFPLVHGGVDEGPVREALASPERAAALARRRAELSA